MRARALYKNGDVSSLEVLLGSKSFQDFSERVELLTRIGNNDAEVLSKAKNAKREIQAKSQELDSKKKEQEALVKTLAARKQQIEEKYNSLMAAGLDNPVEATRDYNPTYRSRSTSWSEPPPASNLKGILGIAYAQMGKPYSYGAAGPDTFDCSGFVQYVFKQAGIYLPHYCPSQYSAGTHVSQSDLQPGDLVFFNGLGHVGIYVGGGQFIHAPHTGSYVKIDSFSGWYASTYCGATRI